MIEIYKNISKTVKQTAEAGWNFAINQSNPANAAETLDNIVKYYSHLYTEEEIEYLKFYFKMKMMEMEQNEGNNNPIG